MTARKKVRVVSPTADVSVVEKLKKAQMGEKDEAAILKDVLLVEAALATDSAVASLDEEVRSLLRTFASQWGRIKAVAWVNPAKDDDKAIPWLSSGALLEKERLLGYEGE
jgi:ABC-type iron transport system FetAB ATPase subunit